MVFACGGFPVCLVRRLCSFVKSRIGNGLYRRRRKCPRVKAAAFVGAVCHVDRAYCNRRRRSNNARIHAFVWGLCRYHHLRQCLRPSAERENTSGFCKQYFRIRRRTAFHRPDCYFCNREYCSGGGNCFVRSQSARFGFPHCGAYLYSACAYLPFHESAAGIRIERRIPDHFCISGFFCASSGYCAGKRNAACDIVGRGVCGWGMLCGSGVCSA